MDRLVLPSHVVPTLDPIDSRVGARIRARRLELGLTQEKLAVGLGVTFQQLQKYERGANRVSASRLFDLTRILRVEPAYFFDASTLQRQGPRTLDLAEADVVRLNEAFQKIGNSALRRSLIAMIDHIADDATIVHRAAGQTANCDERAPRSSKSA